MCGLPRAAERGGDLGGGGAVPELRARGDEDGDDLRFGGVAADTCPYTAVPKQTFTYIHSSNFSRLFSPL